MNHVSEVSVALKFKFHVCCVAISFSFLVLFTLKMEAAGPYIGNYTMPYSVNAIWNLADLEVIMEENQKHTRSFHNWISLSGRKQRPGKRILQDRSTVENIKGKTQDPMEIKYIGVEYWEGRVQRSHTTLWDKEWCRRESVEKCFIGGL